MAGPVGLPIDRCPESDVHGELTVDHQGNVHKLRRRKRARYHQTGVRIGQSFHEGCFCLAFVDVGMDSTSVCLKRWTGQVQENLPLEK